MGLGDCPKCWNVVCTCGHEWETWPEGGLRNIARAVNAAMVSRGFAEPSWMEENIREAIEVEFERNAEDDPPTTDAIIRRLIGEGHA